MQEFLWGTATASYQVEGGIQNNDWWEWEKAGRIKTGDSAIVACDHYNRYKDDFRLTKFLENNAYRFSIEWSRIEPERGKFDEKAIEHYLEMLKELKNLGIEPILTLHHFTIPLWFKEMGGFLNEESPKIFADYIKNIVPYFKDYVNYWITINEPMILSSLGYFLGKWPPGEHSALNTFKVSKNLLLSHMEANKIIKENRSGAQVSIAHHILIFEPDKLWNPLDGAIARFNNFILNYSFLDALTTGKITYPFSRGEFYSDLKNSIDFIGLNYYTRVFVKFSLRGLFREAERKMPKNDFNQYIYPEGIERVLVNLAKRYGLRIMITENGIADREDKWRSEYILKTVESMKNAVKKGVDIFGYMFWSLMDNFEWNEGYSMKFGLFEVNFETQERKPRKSAFTYRDIAKKFKKGLKE